MMKTKKIFALMIAAAMAFAMVPPYAFADVTFTAVDGTPGNPNEGYENLFDGKKTKENGSKWCMDKTAAYVVAKASGLVAVTGYTLTTANDNALNKGRNPKSWTLYGSNDYDEASKTGTWKAIHSVTDDTVMKDVNYTSYSFDCGDNTKLYTYYKFDITANKGDSVIQISELEFAYTECEHDLEEVSSVEPTCEEPGYIIKRCSKCNAEKEEPNGTALGHSRNDSGVCTRCGSAPVIWNGKGYYDDLQTAVNEADENGTVKILRNAELKGALTISKNITIDLNGFKISQTAQDRVIKVESSKVFTLTDSSEKRTGMIAGDSSIQYGGGVYVDSNATFNLVGATISDCSAVTGGGVYVNSNATFNMSGGAVIQNCNTPGNVGGGIYVNGAVTVTDSKILNCSTKNYGGGIYLGSSGSLKLDGSTIEKCTVSVAGGGIYVSEKAKIELKNSEICGNNANSYGGGIGFRSANLTIDTCKINNNTADGDVGGGIFAQSAESIKLIDSEVCGNKAKKSGGGIMMNGVTKLTIDNSEISNNTSSVDGGGIYLDSVTKLTIDNSEISNNTSSVNGGGIYAKNKSSIDFNSGSIDGNSAMWGGGVYLHYGSDMTVSDGSIKNNTAKNNGGGVIVNDAKDGKSAALTMTGGSISENKTINSSGNGNGGGICGQSNAIINISGGSIDSNNALNGGGIYLRDNSAATIADGNISMNIARNGNGGGVYAENSGSIKLTGGTIFGNHATGLGGGIYNDSSVLTVENDPHVMHNNISKYVADDTGYGYAEPLRDNNIYLPSGKKISGSLKEVVAPPMIYVTLADVSQDITDEFDSDCSAYIHSDDNKYAVVYDEQTKTHKLAESVCITLIENEGETGEAIHEYVAKGKAYTPSYEPWRLGYRFLGWCKDGKMYDFSQPVNEPITLTGKWTEYGNAYISLTKDGYSISGSFETAVICLAGYDGSGTLADTAIVEVTEDNKQQTFSSIGFKTEGMTKIMAFMWDKNMNPLTDKASVLLSTDK